MKTVIPSSTYSWPPGPVPTSTYSENSLSKTFDSCGLSFGEAQCAIRCAALEKDAAVKRGKDIRAQREAFLRRQGFDEDYIRRN